MTEMTPRRILDAIREGLEESALLTALGYDATQGRLGRHLLNNELERRGYGRPIHEQDFDQFRTYAETESGQCRGSGPLNPASGDARSGGI
jgi:hypothetical protein